MKDTPAAYQALKNVIENTKKYLPSLRQSDIDRIFFEAKPHDMTKLSIHIAKQLYYNNQYNTALTVLSTAKSALMKAVYHNYLVHKTYCLDKLETCEKEILKNHLYQTQAQPITKPANQTIAHASVNKPYSQSTRSNSNNDSTLLMNQFMIAAVAAQTMNVADDNCRNTEHEQSCPPTSSDEHNHHHSPAHHDNSSYSSSHTHPHQDTTSNDYSSNVQDTHHSHVPDYSSSHNDSSSIYHGSSSLFDNHSSHHGSSTHDYSSSSHNDYSSSNHDYSSSSHDTSSSNDYSSNSYSM